MFLQEIIYTALFDIYLDKLLDSYLGVIWQLFGGYYTLFLRFARNSFAADNFTFTSVRLATDASKIAVIPRLING